MILLPIILLATAIAAVWVRRPRHLWAFPFAAFLATALAGGWIRPVALVSIALLAAVVLGYRRARGRRALVAATLALVLLSLLFGLRLVPGFEDVYLLEDVTRALDDDARVPRFSAEKPLVGLFLLLAFRERLIASVAALAGAARLAWPLVLFGPLAIYALALAAGAAELAPRAPLDGDTLALALVWLGRTAFFTVIAEEMLFRGVIQLQLARAFEARAGGRWLALGVASALFGLVHLAGGVAFAALATLAGLLYGYAFERTGRIEAAFAAHTVLNVGQALLLRVP